MVTWQDTKGIRVHKTTQILILITLQRPKVVKEHNRWVIQASSNQVVILVSMDPIKEEVAHQSQRRKIKTSPSRSLKISTIITTFSITPRSKLRIHKCLEVTLSKLNNIMVTKVAPNNRPSNNWIRMANTPWTVLLWLRKTILLWVATLHTAWFKDKFNKPIWWVGDSLIRVIQTTPWLIVVKLHSKRMPVETLIMLQSKMPLWVLVEVWLD